MTSGVAERRRRPGWYHGWNIVAIAVMGQVAALALTLNSFSLFLHDWTREFHAPVSAFALGVTLFSPGCALMSPFVGAAADRFPARWIYGAALVGLAAVHFAIGCATARWQIVALYAIALPVVITFASQTTGQALVARWFVRRRGMAMGLTAFGAVVGGIVAPPILVQLIPMIGWRWTWEIYGGVILLLFLPLTLIGTRDRPRPGEGDDYVGPSGAPHAKTTLTVRQILARRNFWAIICAFLPMQCAFMALSLNLAPLVNSHGFDAKLPGGLLALMGVTALCSKFVAGVLVDRLGNRIPFVMASLFVAAGMGVLATLGGSLATLILGVMLVSMGGASWTLLASSSAAEFGMGGFGKAYGLINMLTPIAAATPTVFAKAEETSGSYTPALMVCAIAAVVGAGIACLIDERRGGGRERAGPLAGEALASEG